MKTNFLTLPVILAVMFGLQSVPAQMLPIPVTLNGFWLMFDDRRAFLKTAAAGNFSLRVGQQRNGIKLLSIDPKSGCAVIDNRGEQEVLHICNTPNLTLQPAGDAVRDSATAGEITQTVNVAGGRGGEENALEDSTAIKAQPALIEAGGATGIAKKDTSSGAVSANNGDPATGQTSKTEIYQWWVKEAQKIENARNQTAQRVLAGEWPPYPRTPLTPADANPQLVSADSLYMEHGPGIIISRQ